MHVHTIEELLSFCPLYFMELQLLFLGPTGHLLVCHLGHVSLQPGILRTSSESWRLKGLSFSLPACPCSSLPRPWPKLLGSIFMVPHHGPMGSLKSNDSQEAVPGSVLHSYSCMAWAMNVPKG